jgi:hypothetical protein
MVRNAYPPLAGHAPDHPCLRSTVAAVASIQLRRHDAAAQSSLGTLLSDASGHLDTSSGVPPELAAASIPI